LPGFYEVGLPDGGVQLFAVNLPREESNPEKLAEAEVAALASGAGATLANDPSALRAATEERTEGREVWRPLLWITLLFLFLEPLIQQRFSQRRGGTA
jgi:hypothetical protein